MKDEPGPKRPESQEADKLNRGCINLCFIRIDLCLMIIRKQALVSSASKLSTRWLLHHFGLCQHWVCTFLCCIHQQISDNLPLS